MRGVLSFIAKGLTALFLLAYVATGVLAAVTLFRIEVNRRENISALSGIIDQAILSNRPDDVLSWVRLRPLEETPALIKAVSPKSAQLAPSIFFEFSRREMRLNHMEDSLFWRQVGRYRLRYDTLRCATPDGAQTFDRLLANFSSQRMNDFLSQHPEKVKPSIQRTLDFDAKYPAGNDPEKVCTAIEKLTRNDAPVVPRAQWGEIRQLLRKITESALKEMP